MRGRCQRHQKTTTDSTSIVIETRHSRSRKLEGHWHPDELYFDQLEINTLGTVDNTDGTPALVQLKFQSPQCTTQLICKLRCRMKRHTAYYLYRTVSPRGNVTQYCNPTNLHPSNMRITAYGGHSHTLYISFK